jgi:hypothetical protein
VVKGIESTYRKSDCGCASLISTVPTESFVTMPLMAEHFVGFFSQASMPTMFEKKPIPGEFSLKSRMIVDLKSHAYTGSPFEYFSPLRSVNR